MSSHIPIIDFAKWPSTNDQVERLSLAKSIVSACQQVGFVYIINHGMNPQLLDNAFETTKRLFALSHEAKMQAPHPDGPAVHRGYSYPGLEKVSQYAGGEQEVGEQLREVTDCKERAMRSEANGTTTSLTFGYLNQLCLISRKRHRCSIGGATKSRKAYCKH